MLGGGLCHWEGLWHWGGLWRPTQHSTMFTSVRSEPPLSDGVSSRTPAPSLAPCQRTLGASRGLAEPRWAGGPTGDPSARGAREPRRV